VSVALIAAASAYAGDGVALKDHWTRIGLTAADIDLIDRLDLTKAKVEGLITRGVSVREYARRPWESMGITEKQWLKILDQGSDVGRLERLYSREDDAPEIDRPSLPLSFVAPGLAQFREGRPVAGSILAGLGASFLALTFTDKEADGSVNVTWPILLGTTMFYSAGDVWYNHYRPQSNSNFTWNLLPTLPSARGFGLKAVGEF
jgi:hypothetical protein